MDKVVIIKDFSKELGYKTNRILEVIKKYDYVKDLLFRSSRSYAILMSDLEKYCDIIMSRIKYKNAFMDFMNRGLKKDCDVIIFNTKKIPKKNYNNTDFHVIFPPVGDHKKEHTKTLSYGVKIKGYDTEKLTENKFEYELIINKFLTIFSSSKRLNPKDFEYIKDFIKIYNGKILEDTIIINSNEEQGCRLDYFVTYCRELSFVIDKAKLVKFRFSIPKLGLNVSYSYYTFDATSCKEHIYALNIKHPTYVNFIDEIKLRDYETHAKFIRRTFIAAINWDKERVPYREPHEGLLPLPWQLKGLVI